MFKKPECKKCRKKVSEKFSFCPYCGFKLSSEIEDEKDWGMIGKNDLVSASEMQLPMGFNHLFNHLMKNLNTEFQNQLQGQEQAKSKKVKKNGLSISISAFGNGAPRIKLTPMGAGPEIKQKKVHSFKSLNFTSEQIEKFARLKKEEPKTNIRRLSSKVVYDLEVPGVNSTKDVSIIKLESSVEIKAISEKKAYSKIISISLPIIAYGLSDGRLTLEFGVATD